MSTKTPYLALIAAFVAGTALAQTKPATAPAPAPAKAEVAETAEAVFQRMDTNNDKMLSLDEFKTGIEQRNRAIILARLQAQFKSMDKNNSGTLEPTEFFQLPVVKSGGTSALTFAAVDTDKDQKINFKEYVVMVGKYAESHASAPSKPKP